MIYRIARKKQLRLLEQFESQGIQLEMDFDNDHQTIFWQTLKKSAKRHFIIWVNKREMKWMEWVWHNILEAGLANFTDNKSKLEVYLRFYAIGEIYADFCLRYYDAYSATEDWSVFEILNDVDQNIISWAKSRRLSDNYLKNRSRKTSRKEIQQVLMKRYNLKDPYDTASEIFYDMASTRYVDGDFEINPAEQTLDLFILKLENPDFYEELQAEQIFHVSQWILDGMPHENH